MKNNNRIVFNTIFKGLLKQVKIDLENSVSEKTRSTVSDAIWDTVDSYKFSLSENIYTKKPPV
jgi:hypothetical protein